ncbi:hypothetical protein QAD02_006129 [Eretmocerus hayati]|uniref:Uncharacterized protein n=1 Tax=Eretmocerus hayati TaxID=131215 RepID=A0ACC2N2A4_9HYME|nr:hypothetical protein QAD02_006129 [Eretmocerus hayati]
MFLILLILLKLLSVNARIVETPGIVSTLTEPISTDRGIVFGEILKTAGRFLPYASFKGIPFAKPPIKALRFKPPVDIDLWEKPLYALSDDSLMCIQLDENKRDVVGSEDCLYLNVYTPHTSFGGKSKAVMVWIHGGAFNAGNSNSTRYGPDFFMEEDVVLVTVNYRLGPFGFLNFNHENATGNAGLKDQNLALKWVQRNIHLFGGDPNRVTIFGKDAGAVAVDLHLISDMSVGLFQKSIAMGGSPLCFWWGFQNTTEAENNVYLLVRKFGVNKSDKSAIMKILQKIPADQIMKATLRLNSEIPFRPTIENVRIAKNQDKFITECPLRKFQRGNHTKGPHMLGFSSSDLESFVKEGYIDLGHMIDNSFEYMKNLPNSAGVMRLVRGIHAKTVDKDTLTKVANDLFFTTGIDVQQKLITAGNEGRAVFYYNFFPNSEGMESSFESESDYLFYRTSTKIREAETSSNFTIIRKNIVRMWANFAKYGSPTPLILNDDLLKINWSSSGGLGIGLDIGSDLQIRYTRPTNPRINYLQKNGYERYNFEGECRSGVSTSARVSEADINDFEPISKAYSG